jgi:PLP dependent protein
MAVNTEVYQKIKNECAAHNAQLIAVSKTKPNTDIEALYQQGQRLFGENYVQELVDKHATLPTDIDWHFIGHLQTNKVKYIAPFVSLIHGVDSEKLLTEINKQGAKNNRVINCLLQMHIAQEETKFGLDEAELNQIMQLVTAGKYPNVVVKGLMGMASFSTDMNLVRSEFLSLKNIYDTTINTYSLPDFNCLSMGMSADYTIALALGATHIRIGSMLFGARGAV